MSNINESAANLWSTYNKQFYTQFDMHFTGFIIQGVSGKITSGEHMYRYLSDMQGHMHIFCMSVLGVAPACDPNYMYVLPWLYCSVIYLCFLHGECL